jgi:hypothetical protein
LAPKKLLFLPPKTATPKMIEKARDDPAMIIELWRRRPNAQAIETGRANTH